MASPVELSTIELATGYLFRDSNLLRTCLTAAIKIDGKEEKVGKKDDGNRKLSMLGQSVINLAANSRAFNQSLDRGEQVLFQKPCQRTELSRCRSHTKIVHFIQIERESCRCRRCHKYRRLHQSVRKVRPCRDDCEEHCCQCCHWRCLARDRMLEDDTENP